MSPETMFVANDMNATYRPSALMQGLYELSMPCAPEEETETRQVSPNPAEDGVPMSAIPKTARSATHIVNLRDMVSP